MKIQRLTTIAALALLSTSTGAQESAAKFGDVSLSMQEKLEASLSELDLLRQQIQEEKVPLNKELNRLEAELLDARADYQEVARTLDGRTLDLSNLTNEIQRRKEEATYLSGLFSDYIRGFEARLHIAELQLYSEDVDAAKLAPENSELSEGEVFGIQADLLLTSITRLEEGLGGTFFDGRAKNPNGLLKDGKFALIGPVALFSAGDGIPAGTAEQVIGSLEPNQIVFTELEDQLAAENVLNSGAGSFPLDPTLGSAHKMADAEVTILEEFEKGGNVMWAILVLAGLALLVALYKFFALLFVRKPSKARVKALLEAVQEGDEERIHQQASLARGPAGRMLKEGVAHLNEPRELIEEVMYETVLTARLKLERLLSFVAVCAASAPLLGLLGTVTGIISTFKLITVFGSGDVKMLSGGISEALITTKYGLVVAIPSLLIHAFLSRKVRGIVGDMEKTAVAFANAVSVANGRETAADDSTTSTREAANGRQAPTDQVRTQVKEILTDMMVPKVEEKLGSSEPEREDDPVEVTAG